MNRLIKNKIHKDSKNFNELKNEDFIRIGIKKNDPKFPKHKLLSISYNDNINILNQNIIKKDWTDIFNIKKIFLINLHTQKEKLLLMKFKLQKASIHNYDIIKAYNGYHDIQLYKYFQKIKVYPHNRITSIGALGIIQTYKILLSKINYSNLNDKITIFEDDICFHNDFYHTISSFKNDTILQDIDIIYLGSNIINWSDDIIYQKLHNNFIIIKNYPYEIYGAYAIIISVKLLKLIKNYLNSIIDNYLPIDIILSNLIKNHKLTIGIFNPNLVIPIVSSSINMGYRDQTKFFDRIKQDYRNYQYIQLSQQFFKIYTDYLSYNLNFRGNHTHNYEINNLQISKLLEDNNKFFCIIITSYNNSSYIKKNLDSVRLQTYPHWRIIYYNDNSSDNTSHTIQKYIDEYKLHNKITLINSNIRNFQAFGRWTAYQSCDDDEICVLLDGDDWLYDNYVLHNLNNLYLQKNVMITYGHFHLLEHGKLKLINKLDFPKDIIKNKSYRKYDWISQHMRTSQASLLKTIPLNYIKDHNDEYIKCVSDFAEMFWILEKSNGKHCMNNFNCYVYNKDASLKYDNSYYNRNKFVEWNNYRTILENKYRHFNDT